MIGKMYRWLFDAHHHEWETIKTQPFHRFVTDRLGKRRNVGEGTLYTLKCKACGDIKSCTAEVD